MEKIDLEKLPEHARYRWAIADRILTEIEGEDGLKRTGRLRRTGLFMIFLDYIVPQIVPVLSLLVFAFAAGTAAAHRTGWHGLGAHTDAITALSAIGGGSMFTGTVAWRRIKAVRRRRTARLASSTEDAEVTDTGTDTNTDTAGSTKKRGD